LRDVAGADAAVSQQKAAVVFVAGRAVIRRGHFFAGFSGSLDECLADV